MDNTENIHITLGYRQKSGTDYDMQAICKVDGGKD